MPAILKYPLDLDNTNSNFSYIVFRPLVTVKVTDQDTAGGNAPTKQKNGVNERTDKGTTIPTIYMFFTGGINSSIAPNWQDEELGFAGQVIGAAKGKLSIGEIATRAGNLAGANLKTLGAKALGGITGTNVQGAYDLSRGKIINPHLNVLFKGINFREFSFEFDFNPRNDKEANSAIQIVNMFKKYSLPTISNSEMTYPPKWEIETKSGLDRKIIQKFKRSVCTACTVTYNSHGVWTTFPDGTPTEMKLALTFREIELLQQSDINIDGVSY
jgi:hypothetical protein